MATLVDPGKVLDTSMTFLNAFAMTITSAPTSNLSGIQPTIFGDTLSTPVGSRLKLVTGEVTSDGANLIVAPAVQFWG